MKVLKEFTDKVTRIRHTVGSDYTGDRGQELFEKGLVSEPEKSEKQPAKEKKEITPKKEKREK